VKLYSKKLNNEKVVENGRKGVQMWEIKKLSRSWSTFYHRLWVCIKS